MKYGKWTTTQNFKKRGSSIYVECVCECNLKKFVLKYDLIRGKSTQCSSCRTIEKNLKHGQNRHDNITYEYRLWVQLNYKNELCSDWSKSFELFFKDLGIRANQNYNLCKKNREFKHSISNSFWGHKKLKYFKDIKNQKIGKWVVLEEGLVCKGVRWLCQCECGRKDYIDQWALINKKSFGCKSCAMKGKTLKHGKSKNPIYKIYYSMLDRCRNKNKKEFQHYGGRGIKVCERWIESFQNFCEDMGPRPTDKHSIDRIDVNGNYCPENCKWSTQKEQVANKRKVGDMQKEIQFLKEELEKYKKKFCELNFEETLFQDPVIL